MNNHEPTLATRSLFWAVILCMLVVGGLLAYRLQASLDRAQLMEARFTHAITGSNQALWSWTIPASRADWDASTFWVGPNFYDVAQAHEQPWPLTIKHFFEHVHPDDRDRLYAAMAQSADTGNSFAIDFQMLAVNGNYIWMTAHGRISVINGQRTLSGAITDIDARMLERLRNELVLNSVQAAIIMCGPDRKITVYNDRAQEMFGWKKEDMLGQKIDRMLPADYLSVHDKAFVAFTERLLSANGDTTVRRDCLHSRAINAAGNEFPVLLEIQGIKYRGQIAYVAVIRNADNVPLPAGFQFQPLRTPDAIKAYPTKR